MASFLISLPFWWDVNIFQAKLENFLFWKEMTENPAILAAKADQEALDKKLQELWPLRRNGVQNPDIQAKAAISILSQDGVAVKKILFAKDEKAVLPVASITKLMTASVSIKNYDLSQHVTILKTAVEQEGDFSQFKIGETFTIKDILYPLLIESSNDAAELLSELAGSDNFVELMNREAQNLNLNNTYFFNATGLDQDNPSGNSNYSTAEELVKLALFILRENPLILEISANPTFDLYDSRGVLHHQLQNTNKLFRDESSSWKKLIIGSKTGWTEKSQGCLILVLKAPKNEGYIVNIILGSPDRFSDMKELTDWVYSAFKW